MKILGTGLTGLVGSRIVELLSSYEFENISRSTGIDITNLDQLTSRIEQSNAPYVLHLAAKTDVDGCEKDKSQGKDGEAWRINVTGTENVATACKNTGKTLIYISTDFVFNGKIEEREYYTEIDTPDPVNWYAQTKYEGEKKIQAILHSWIIVRIAYPYRASFTKMDFVRAIKNRLTEGKEIKGVTDHIFAPTFIDDLATVIDVLIKNNAQGIYHAVGSECLSPYDASLKIASEFGLNVSLISKITREEFFQNRAQRPFRLALKNDKIEHLGVKMKTLTEGLQEIKNQLEK